MREPWKNILIIKPSSLGDIVLALPALSALRSSFPYAKISWLIRPEFAPLLKNHPHLTETILFDRHLLAKAWYNPHAFAELRSLVHRLRDEKFDAVIDLQGLFRTAVLAKFSGSPVRFGMKNAREFAGLFYTHKISQNSDSVHLVDYYMKIVEAAGAQNTTVQFVLPVDAGAADSVNRLLAEHNVDRNHYAVFIPGSAHPDKCWPVENFAVLADKISPLFHLPIVLAGAKSEKAVTEKLSTLTKVPVVDFAGLTNLNELVALLKSARLVVSNDTGPGHIAAALGSPLVMMFSWSNPARIYPYGRKDCAVAIDLDTRGEQIKSSDPKHNVRNITVDEVFAKTCEQL
jgi:heptosyltransferase-1